MHRAGPQHHRLGKWPIGWAAVTGNAVPSEMARSVSIVRRQ